MKRRQAAQNSLKTPPGGAISESLSGHRRSLSPQWRQTAAFIEVPICQLPARGNRRRENTGSDGQQDAGRHRRDNAVSTRGGRLSMQHPES